MYAIIEDAKFKGTSLVSSEQPVPCWTPNRWSFWKWYHSIFTSFLAIRGILGRKVGNKRLFWLALNNLKRPCHCPPCTHNQMTQSPASWVAHVSRLQHGTEEYTDTTSCSQHELQILASDFFIHFLWTLHLTPGNTNPIKLLSLFIIYINPWSPFCF